MATLILVLVAVAAGVGFYAWFTQWQSSATGQVASPAQGASLTIGGSTTVFPLTQIAIPWFEANNSGITISDQQGGSVAGAESFCGDKIDVGAASSAFTTSQLITDGCTALSASNVAQKVVGLDAIVAIASTTNPIFGTTNASGHVPSGDFSFNASTMLAIYIFDSSTAVHQNVAGGINTYNQAGNLAPAYVCGNRHYYNYLANNTTAVGHTQAAAAYQTTCPTIGAATSIPWSSVPFPAGCLSQSSAINWSGQHCEYGYANANKIKAYDRLDSSGTEQGFVQKYILTGSELAKDASGNSCGTDNQLESCGIQVTHESGNPALAAAVAGDANGLGFNAFGIATATGSGLYVGAYMGASNAAPIFPTVSNVLGAYKGTTSAALAYAPWRPLEYLTWVPGSSTDPLSAQTDTLVTNFVTFVQGSEVNQDLCQQTGYISLYAA